MVPTGLDELRAMSTHQFIEFLARFSDDPSGWLAAEICRKCRSLNGGKCPDSPLEEKRCRYDYVGKYDIRHDIRVWMRLGSNCTDPAEVTQE